MSWLSAILAAVLAVALIAFGWHPCCCVTGNPCVTCPAGLPSTLHGVLVLSGGNCGCANGDLNGEAVTFTWNSGTLQWQSAVESTCYNMATFTRQFFLACTNATQMTLTVNESGFNFGATYACAIGAAGPIVSTSVACPPSFQAVFTGTVTTLSISGGTCPCAGATWTFTVTA